MLYYLQDKFIHYMQIFYQAYKDKFMFINTFYFRNVKNRKYIEIT